jgi:hypothetical protein
MARSSARHGHNLTDAAIPPGTGPVETGRQSKLSRNKNDFYQLRSFGCQPGTGGTRRHKLPWAMAKKSRALPAASLGVAIQALLYP